MIEGLFMIAVSICMIYVTYRFFKKVDRNPCVKFTELLESDEFRACMILFVTTFISIIVQFTLMSMADVTTSSVLHMTNSILLIASFYCMQRII